MVPGGFFMVFHGFRWVLMVFHGSRLFFYGSRWVFWFCRGSSLVFYGSRWVFNAFCIPKANGLPSPLILLRSSFSILSPSTSLTPAPPPEIYCNRCLQHAIFFVTFWCARDYMTL